MPKDHFVPQHYLRNFGVNGRIIAVTTLSPYRFIPVAPIDGQCQEDNFYEKILPINDLIGASESGIAPLLKMVIDNKDFNDEELNALKWMAAIFHVRTRRAHEALKVLPRHIACEVLRAGIKRGDLPPPPEGDEDLEKVIDFRGVPGFLMMRVIPCWMELATLHCKLITPQGSERFITSDDPVCILNQFCTVLEPHRRAVGFSKAGFQLMLPLSPILCFFLYDPAVYKVGNRKDRLVSISDDDVEIINSLQVQNTEKCLYFNDPKLELKVERLVSRYMRFRVPIDEMLRVLPGRNEKEQILHVRAPAVKLPKPWTFCRYLKSIKATPGDRRKPEWTDLCQKVTEDIKENPNAGSIYDRIQRILGESPREKS